MGDQWTPGTKIRLESKASGKNLRIMDDDSVNASGGEGEKATWEITRDGAAPHHIKFKNCKGKFLRIDAQGNLDGGGQGGIHCEFKLDIVAGGFVVLESCHSEKWHVGVADETGAMKAPKDTGKGDKAQFKILIDWDTKYGDCFKAGANIHLKSAASGQNLKIKEDAAKTVEATGKTGDLATWIVHRDCSEPQYVKLQNKKGAFLRIQADGSVDGGGQGGIHCEFLPERVGDNFTFQSVHDKTWHVGVKEDGSVKDPKTCRQGTMAQFSAVLA